MITRQLGHDKDWDSVPHIKTASTALFFLFVFEKDRSRETVGLVGMASAAVSLRPQVPGRKVEERVDAMNSASAYPLTLSIMMNLGGRE